MAQKTRLELTWIGKDIRPRLEPRILMEDPERSYHAIEKGGRQDLFDNHLIFGDNLLALKALEQEYAGKVKCIYIDPPFNTGQAFAQFNDGVEHSLWLSLIRDRLEILSRLLAPSGSIWVHCDDNEQAYLRVMMDEVFGREHFQTTIIWQKVDSPNDNKVPITPDHEYIVCYANSSGGSTFHPMPDPSLVEAYRGPDENGRMFRDRLLKKNGKNSLRSDRPSMYFGVPAPDGTEIFPIHDDRREACWSAGKDTVADLISRGLIYWVRRLKADGEVWVPYTREYAPELPTRPYATIWCDVMTTRQSRAHQNSLLPNAVGFATPKPEQLIQRILQIATDEGDLVLDSFAGSGTTGAVAHKMGRRWIMVELGDHIHTHIIPRMKKVIDGTDPGGITESVNWRGGGGFRYYRLAPSLIEQDRFGQPVISKKYNPAMLAEAMCKLMGYHYAPNDQVFWQHGRATENDYLYVTTQTLTHEQLAQLSEEVGESRSLLVCCSAYRGKPAMFKNLTVEKIPTAVLNRCEWGKDDYSLQVANLPQARGPETPPQMTLFDPSGARDKPVE